MPLEIYLCIVGFVEKQKCFRCNVCLKSERAALRRKEKKEVGLFLSEGTWRAVHTQLCSKLLCCCAGQLWSGIFMEGLVDEGVVQLRVLCHAETLRRFWSKYFIQVVLCLSRC